VEVDQARQENPRPKVEGGVGVGRMVRGRHDSRQAAGGVDLNDRVGLVAGPAGGKWGEEPGPESERRPIRKAGGRIHGGR
jgi:hypothetical protein